MYVDVQYLMRLTAAHSCGNISSTVDGEVMRYHCIILPTHPISIKTIFTDPKHNLAVFYMYNNS